MLRHQKHEILVDSQPDTFTSTYPEPLEQDSKHHSPGCDDSGVFLEDPVVSSPETPSKSALSRLHNITLQKFSAEEFSQMRQYTLPETLDSDAEKSDDLGLASSSIDSADDLDGDPLPSTLQICPPAVPTRQKPPPVPARKSLPKSGDNLKQHNRLFLNEVMTPLEVPNHLRKTPLSKSSSSGEDSNFGEGDLFTNEDHSGSFCLNENSKNILNQQKSNFVVNKSLHEDTLLQLQRDHSLNQESKTNFLARTLSSSSPLKNLEMPNGVHAVKPGEYASSLKWKSEECLRTAAENKWSLPGRRYEKSVSVKDRIAMFSGMESNQSTGKKDLQRYGSENNIKTVATTMESKKLDISTNDDRKTNSLLRDSKWQSMHNIDKKYTGKEVPFPSSSIKPALSIPSLLSCSPIDNFTNSAHAPFPIKLDVEPLKPIVSTYPETQLTNNKRYNYGLYSLKNLKNTEDLLSKKVAGSNLLSIIDSRKQPTRKLKGLVIPDKPLPPDANKTLPTIVSSDSEGVKDCRRASLPITVVTASNNSMSLPRNKRLECPLVQKQTSLTEPPWKTERTNNTLPKYSPAFKKRSLELPGSSLSPTPPSSITSPLSPPPSSPSSICSSNASSSLQQNVFQFSLSHSKPVKPLKPEKALMSPPSEGGDIFGDSSPLAPLSVNVASDLIEESKSATPAPAPDLLPYGTPNVFTSSTKSVALQPLLVEALVKTPSSSQPPRAAVCISKTEIHLRREGPRPNVLENEMDAPTHQSVDAPEIRMSSTIVDYSETRVSESLVPSKTGSIHSLITESRTSQSLTETDYMDGQTSITNGMVSYQNCGPGQTSKMHNRSDVLSPEVPLVGKFRASPLNLQGAKPTPNVSSLELCRDRRPILPSECDESEDDDSHSTLSHRTEDSRHTTTDDCLSDATTDSFEKPRMMPSNLRTTYDDYASTEGYLSDASTDVSLRRFTHRPIDASAYSTEEYLSDATAESPDPEWVSNRAPPSHTDSRYSRRNESSREADLSDSVDPDLRPKRLSQQKTVLRASVEPSGSVQKFKALAEKWEQRVISPPPPPVTAAPVSSPMKRMNSASVVLQSNSTASTTVIKGKGGSLPPSLMPRNVCERRAPAPISGRRSSPTTPPEPQEPCSNPLETNGWSHHEEIARATRSDSTGSDSSKTTLKDEEMTEVPSSPVLQDVVDPLPKELATLPQSNGHRTPSPVKPSTDSWNNEPRNRRGADFSRSGWSARSAFAAKTSVSDIRRSFENGHKETEKPILPKKPTVTVISTSPAVAHPRPCSTPAQQDVSVDEDVERLLEDARRQLQEEGVGGGQFSVLPVILLREDGMDGGSVGITLAGGADYEVKEITVHKVIGGSIADRDGRLMKGDRVMSINGRDVRGVSHGEALHILKAPNPKVLLVIARSAERHQLTSNTTPGGKKQLSHNHHGDAESFLVELQKDATGLGFSIEGGKDSPQGDRPLLIKRVFKGGSADKDGQLGEGDEIISVNSHPVSSMTRTEAWNFLKKLPEGPVRLQLRKNRVLILS